MQGRQHERAALTIGIPIVRTVFLPGPGAFQALAPDPVEPPAPRFTRNGQSRSSPAPAPNPGISCIRTEDGTVILFDRASGRAVSGLTRAAAEARLRSWKGRAPGLIPPFPNPPTASRPNPRRLGLQPGAFRTP
ncbi:hypothetical protein ACVOMV_32395 [Mesorhizobium atlanticum]